MANERVDSEIVTQFLLNTCRLRPKLTEHAVQAAWRCAALATLHLDDDVEAVRIPLTTGSVAEFYIEPMLPHVGDIDVMYYYSTQLAIPRGHPPPTQLPAEFRDYVNVAEIIHSHFPGYVYLKLRYLLTYCPEDEKYNYVEYDQEVYKQVGKRDSTAHGPALLTVFNRPSQLSVDTVACIRCLSWPPQAAHWPTRHRNYDWPDSATVDRVVNNGCDTVHVAHRLCRQHELLSKYQWRLSFSRAEIVLINSWMPIQQIVYHMLRVFMKNERLKGSDSSEADILSNYHLKTLMLWACELKPRSWWTDDLNLIRICVELLHTLAVWLSEARCQHYFVHDCNLLDHVDNSLSTPQLAVSELMSITETSLCDWFINCYIRQCAQLCPQHIARLFDDVSTSTRLQNAVAAVVEWRLNRLLTSSYSTFILTQTAILDDLSHNYLTVPWCLCLMRELPLIHEDLLFYYVAVAFLHVAVKISRNSLTDELLDVLSTICLQSNHVRHRHIARHSSVLSLSQAAKLMKVVANNSRSTVQMIEIELSKAYLHEALRYKDSDSDSIYCLTNVYLAVLYYTTGQYQTAIDHCTLVMRSQDHSQCSSDVVQGELLPKIDDNIDTVLGLAVIYQHVLSAALNQQQTQYVSVFSTELFARYLHIRCLSVINCINCHDTTQASLPDEIQQYELCLCESPDLATTDVLAFKFASFIECQTIKRKLAVMKEELNPTTPGYLFTPELLVELLQKSAVEHLTTFRQFEVQHYGSLGLSTVTTYFEALYAYKHGQYQHCLQLSTQNVYTVSVIGHPEMSLLFLYPEFAQLLDDDIVSVLALTLIVDPSRSDNTFHVSVDQLTLSVYLMVKCQMQLHHSETSLAQSLDYIQVARRRRRGILCLLPQVPAQLDLLVLKLAERIALKCLCKTNSTQN